jgi:hypothetical protein
MAHPRQQQVARGVNVLDQRAHALDAVGRNQTLLRENIAQVGVEVLGKAFRTGNLGWSPFFSALRMFQRQLLDILPRSSSSLSVRSET